MMTSRTISYLPPLSLKVAAAVLCLFTALALARVVPEARAQDILIVRPLNNSQTVAAQAEIVFEVNVSSFAPVIEVKFNGEPQPIEPAPTVNVRKRMRLQSGFNTILVEVATEFETASKEFEIRFGKAPKKEEKDHFQLVTILGWEQISNPLSLPDSSSVESAARSFVVLVPRLDFFPGENNILRLQMIISRDSFDSGALVDEEIAFTQFTLSWIDGFGKSDSWTLGTGYNLIYSGFDGLVNGLSRQTYDSFVFTDWRLGFGENSSFFEFGVEFKQQEFVEEATEQDEDEDSQIITLRTILESQLWVFKNRFKFSFANTDADGKLKDKDQIKLSDELSHAFGPIVLGFGARVKRNDFKESNPNFADVAPSETLISYVVNAAWAISNSWILTLEGVSESQSSNVAESEYDNTVVTAAAIYVF